jgi:hypothetical protein
MIVVSMGSISETVGDGFFVHHERRGIKMRRRCKTMQEAIETLRSMNEDLVVDLPKKRFYFQEDRILILIKPNFTNAQYKEPYEG